MKRARRWLLAWLAAAALGACDTSDPVVTDETAAELRALRLFLQQQRPGAPAAAAASDRPAIEAALAPLHDVLQKLNTSQRQLEQRQQQLAQEMQRWSQLLVESTNGARAEEGRLLTARLQQMEQTLAAQDQRHQEVEALLQKALDHTADRLQDFLDRLGRGGPSGDAQAAPPNSTPAAAPNGVAPNGAAPPDEKSGGQPDPNRLNPTRGDSDEQPARVERTASVRRPWRWAWLLVAALGVGLGAFYFRRARQRDGPRPRPVDAESANADVLALTSDIVEAPVAEPDVQEIWAAAALLGEAVGRLRQSNGEPDGKQDGAGAQPAVTDDQVNFEDLFVIADDKPPPRKQTSPAPPRRRAPTPVMASGPRLVTSRVRSDAPERTRATILARLLGDPRVLCSPAPTAHVENGLLLVRFAVIPGLTAGEESRLEQDLQEGSR